MGGKGLVSGCDERVAEVAEALRQRDAEVVVVQDPAKLEETAAQLPAGSLSYYVQLPVAVDVSGPTVVGRVRTFLQRGLLARFDAADAVLPALRDDAVVVLVSGNTASEGGNMPDDAAARFALLNVLAHAVRAEKAPGVVRVRILESDAGASDVADVALHGKHPRSRQVADVQAREADMSYEDWRAEIMGMATVQV